MLGHSAANQVAAIFPNSHFIHIMEKRKISEGVSDHTDERGQVSPSELCVEIPAACCQETTNEHQCLCAVSSNRKPGDLLSCLPMGALTHPSHLRIKVFLAKLPTSEGTGQRKQLGRKKAMGRLPVLTGCHHWCSVSPHQLMAPGKVEHTSAWSLRCPARYSNAASEQRPRGKG